VAAGNFDHMENPPSGVVCQIKFTGLVLAKSRYGIIGIIQFLAFPYILVIVQSPDAPTVIIGE
jgi:hypothetical protein